MMDELLDAMFSGFPQDPDELTALVGIAKRTYALYEMLQRVGFDRDQAFDLARIDFAGIVGMSLEMIGGDDDST